MKVVLNPRAVIDLEDIHDWIAADSPRAAKAVADFLAQDTDPELIGTAIFSLGEIGTEESVPALEVVAQGTSNERLALLANDAIGTGPDARGPRMIMIDDGARDLWRVRQILDDPAGDHDWGISAEIDLAASDEVGAAVVRVTEVGQL